MKQRIIIFDGPDGCGKTNMSSYLGKVLDIPTFKNTNEWSFFGLKKSKDYFKTAISSQHPYLLSYLKQTNQSVIFDRAHISEYVYSRVYNRELFDNEVKHCDNLSHELGAKIIIPVRKDYSVVNDEYGVTQEKLEKIHDLYIEYCNITKCDYLLFYVDDDSIQENIENEYQLIREFLGI